MTHMPYVFCFVFLLWNDKLTQQLKLKSCKKLCTFDIEIYSKADPRGELFELSYLLIKHVLTEYFQFHPCHFSFYHVL